MRPIDEETQIQENSLIVSKLDDEYLTSVAHILLPDGHLICFWDFDYGKIGSDLFFTNNMHLMTDLQAVKAKVKEEFADYLAVALDVHT